MSGKIGFWSVFALVTGSQIGSGIFMLPGNLAPYGGLSIAGWGLATLGALLLALVFAQLCSQLPKTGGPHAYVQAAFGPHAAFFTGWTYWVISWVSTTAVITASVGYLMVFFDAPTPAFQISLEILLLLSITALNLKGVQTAGHAEFFLTLIKVIPLFLLPCIALWFIDLNNFQLASNTSNPLTVAQILNRTALLTLWGFVGLESATTPAGAIENPSKTIPRAVISGTICVAILYLLNIVGIMGVVPGSTLMHTAAPYMEATRLLFGGNWHIVISAIAAIICIGTLNAWTLASGQIALGIAEDGLMPKVFAKKNTAGAPFVGLLVSCAGLIPLLLLTYKENIAHQILLIVDFSVTAFLFVYLMCCLAFLKLAYKNRQLRTWIVGLGASGFCLWILSQTDLKILAIATLFIASGIPLYLFQHKRFSHA